MEQVALLYFIDDFALLFRRGSRYIGDCFMKISIERLPDGTHLFQSLLIQDGKKFSKDQYNAIFKGFVSFI